MKPSLWKVVGLLFVLVAVALAPVAVIADEVPPAPIDPIDHGSLFGSVPPRPVGVDDAAESTESGCNAAADLILPGATRAEFCSFARADGRCRLLEIQGNLPVTHTKVTWAPALHAVCIVKMNTTIPVRWAVRVESSDLTGPGAGLLMDRSGTIHINQFDEIYPLAARGSHECNRELGASEQVTLSWSADGGGAFGSGNDPVACN